MKLCLKFVIIFQIFCILFIEINECNYYYNKTLKKDKCHLREFEDNILSMWPSCFGTDRKWPSNETEMDIWCKKALTATKDVKSYAHNCLTGLSKLHLDVVVHSTKKANKYFCTNKQARKRYINKSVCATKTRDGSLKCWYKSLNMLENIKDVKIQKDKLPLLCCFAYLNLDCIFSVHKKFHPEYCSTENINLLDDYLKRTIRDSHRILCSDYRDPNKCVNYFDRLEEYSKSNVIPRYHTYFPPMWKILKTL